MYAMRSATAALLYALMIANATAACNGMFDVLCNFQQGAGGISDGFGSPIGSPASRPSPTSSVEASDGSANDLIPVREYLSSSQIPPVDFGAYGLVILQSKPTESSREKLLRVCRSFVAHFPDNSFIPKEIPMSDRMVTVWPVEDSTAVELLDDDCDFAIDNYDLLAAELAIADAQKQGGVFDGAGPYLVGWSPSSTRGVEDKLALVIDMSESSSQGSIDRQFLFWKNKIVQDPEMWRGGFAVERFRVSLRDFADTYGEDMISAIKLIGFK